MGGEWPHEDEELQIISKEGILFEPSHFNLGCARRLGDKQAMGRHKGKEKRDKKLFHLNPHSDKSKE